MINWPLPSLLVQCRSKSYNFMDDGVSLEYEEFEGAEDSEDCLPAPACEHSARNSQLESDLTEGLIFDLPDS